MTGNALAILSPLAVFLPIIVLVLFSIWRDERARKAHKALPEYRIDYNPVLQKYRIMERVPNYQVAKAVKDTHRPDAYTRAFPTLKEAMDELDSRNALRLQQEGWTTNRSSFSYPSGEKYDAGNNRG